MTAKEKPTAAATKLAATLTKSAERYPQVTEEAPWGHQAMKVKGKTFAWIVADGPTVTLTVKLPRTRHQALMLPGTEPTGYGLGKSGWVTITLRPPATSLRDQCDDWIDESYRAVAPKTLVKQLDGGGAAKKR
jgi:predicted DNA-binding protein (MmcQ/YjbR family)